MEKHGGKMRTLFMGLSVKGRIMRHAFIVQLQESQWLLSKVRRLMEPPVRILYRFIDILLISR